MKNRRWSENLTNRPHARSLWRSLKAPTDLARPKFEKFARHEKVAPPESGGCEACAGGRTNVVRAYLPTISCARAINAGEAA
jgi:hypothetical protein